MLESQYPPDPKHVVDDNPLKASITTAFSLMFFGLTLASALLKLLSTQDLNGIRALLMREDVIGWFVTVAPFMWLGFRTARTWIKTKLLAQIVDDTPDEIAMTRSALFRESIDDFPPTRARETTTATRLVDGSVLLHRGGPVRVAAVDVQDDDLSIPRDPGNAQIDRHAPPDAVQRLDATVEDLHTRYLADTDNGMDPASEPFSEYLQRHGWEWKGPGNGWQKKEEN